jgi:glycosyltransferase involved in cell wall biosynthesis
MDEILLIDSSTRLKAPYFSILVTAYNRGMIIRRCIDSCLNQLFHDFEVIVVDDGSSDNTLEVLEQINDPRIKIIRHLENQGINAARLSGRLNAMGKWYVNLDSDWELFPYSLQRLHEITSSLDQNILGVRARQILDTGFISPPFLPEEPVIDYVGRLKYMEMGGSADVLGCYRKEAFHNLKAYPERKGGAGIEFLDILNLHQQGLMLHVEDILCKQYTDSPNSVTRGNMKIRTNNLKQFAPDMLWMYEETIRLHGSALQKYAPNELLRLSRNIALQNLYIGKRMQGLRTMLIYLRHKPFDLVTWITLFLGLVGPEFILYGNALRNSFRNLFTNFSKKFLRFTQAIIQ